MSDTGRTEEKLSAYEQEIADLEQYKLKRAREDVLAFAKYCIPGFEISWHHRVIAKYLTRMAKGEVTRLLVTVPPGHGKSTLCSIAFPAFVLGFNRNNKVLTASYNQSLSTKFSRQVQRLMDSPEYKRVFPNTQLPQGERARGKTSYMRTQSEFEIQDALGFYKASSVGGTATGVRLTCVVGNTLVSTENGAMRIEDFFSLPQWPLVWGYDATTGGLRLCRVKAVQRKIASHLVTVATSNGRHITCTPEHLFHTSAGVGKQAAAVTSQKQQCPGGMCACKVLDVSQGGQEKNMSVSDADSQRHQVHILRQKLLGCGGKAEVRLANECAKMHSLSAPVFANAQVTEMLQHGVQKHAAQPIHGDSNESGLATRPWSQRKLADAVCVYSHSSYDPQTRQEHLRNLPSTQSEEISSCSPYRSSEANQCTNEFDNALRLVSCDGPQAQFVEASRVSEHCPGQYVVYDIQVEDCKSFVANGIAVFNCAIVDDPVKSRADANSITYRENTWDWYTSTLLTRLDKGGSVLVVLTRWHQDDLGGRIITAGQEDANAEQYTVVELPAICEEEGNAEDPRKEGEALWPSRFPLDKLKRTRATIGERDFVSLYQQQPTPADGAVLKGDWLKYYDVLPDEFEQVCIVADLGFKDDEARSDFSVFQIWGTSMGKFYLIDQVRDRMSWVRQKRVMQRLAQSYPYTAIYIEAAANGEALVSEVRQLGLTGVLPISPKGSKLTRLEAISATVEAGDVFLPNPKMAGYQWVAQKLVPELLSFPSGKHDDQVDAFSMAIGEMRKRSFCFDISGGLAIDKNEDVPLNFLNLYLS